MTGLRCSRGSSIDRIIATTAIGHSTPTTPPIILVWVKTVKPAVKTPVPIVSEKELPCARTAMVCSSVLIALEYTEPMERVRNTRPVQTVSWNTGRIKNMSAGRPSVIVVRSWMISPNISATFSLWRRRRSRSHPYSSMRTLRR